MALQVEGDGNVLQVVVGPRPPNSVLLSLDGTDEQVGHNYIDCQDHYRRWHIEMEILHENNVSRVFMTPLGSTFYYGMSYDQRCLVFVVEGRTGWLHGYYATKGIYEFANSSRREPYIDHARCNRLPFEGNHRVISPRIGQTRIGLNALRDAFNTIWKYDGGAEHVGLRQAFGVIVVHICESLKLQPVFNCIHEAFVNRADRRLAEDGDDFIRYLITNWSKLSGYVMRAICDPGYNFYIRDFPKLSSVLAILPHLAVLHIDGWFDGPFEHDRVTELSHWEPLELGTNVPSVVDIPFLEKHTYDECGGKDRDQQNDGQSGGKQKREGDGKGRHHGESKCKRGGGNRGKGQQGGGGGGRGRQRGGVSLSAAGFPLIRGWSGGQGKELSMDQNPIGCVMQPKDLACMCMPMCKLPGMSIMEESKYPWCQLIKNCSLTSLSFYMTNLQQQDLGTVDMTRGGDRLSWTEVLKWIGTALLGLEEWYLIGWG